MIQEANPAKILHLFGQLQEHIYNGVIQRELNNTLKYIRDPKIHKITQEIADFLGLEITETFQKENNSKFRNIHKELINHFKQTKNKYEKIVELLPKYDSKWTENLYKVTEQQVLFLSQQLVKLDCEPGVYDINENEIIPGDLVAYNCHDQDGKEYEHYGVVMHSSKGLVVKHFFSGPTIKAQNPLVEKGIGYIHSISYTPEWLFKEHPPENTNYQEIQKRIEESSEITNKVWNKLRYNCEHWAREMVEGVPRCTQIDRMKEEQRKKKKAKNTQ